MRRAQRFATGTTTKERWASGTTSREHERTGVMPLLFGLFFLGAIVAVAALASSVSFFSSH